MQNKPQPKRMLYKFVTIFLIFICVLVILTLWEKSQVVDSADEGGRGGLTGDIIDPITPPLLDPGEEMFDEPIGVVWSGEVFAFLGSGNCYGLVKIPNDKEYPLFLACYPNIDERVYSRIGREVTIAGSWRGIDCAYKNTIFGKCVPYVEIEKMKAINYN